jgi:hypothetical protein
MTGKTRIVKVEVRNVTELPRTVKIETRTETLASGATDDVEFTRW